jgi:hypothetical protein
MDLFTASYRHLAHEAARTANATPRSKPSRRGVSIFPKLYRRQTNWAARNKAAVSNATLQEFLDTQKKDQCYRTDDFLANGEQAAQKFLFATLIKAGKTILFEPDGIVVKEDVASITIHGPNVDKF